MPALPVLVLSLVAASGACPAGCPAPADTLTDATPDPASALGDASPVADQTLADLDPDVDAGLDPLGLVEELTATRLPEGQPAPPSPDGGREPRAPSPSGSGQASASPSSPEPAPTPGDGHLAREDPGPRAQGDGGHAGPAWPEAQGEAVGPRGADLVASLLVGLAAVGLYHKLSKDRALEHEARQRILAFLAEQPGAGTTDVADDLDVAYRTARHHLEVLARFDLVTSAKRRGRWRWARPEDADEVDEGSVPEVQRELLAELEDEPGLHLSELARRLGAAKATVKHHLDLLDERGEVRDERVGPLRRFFPVDAESTA
jgi:DNA-binding transcriptional ArsR family regulator